MSFRITEDRRFTVEENELLNRMAAGELDGFVGRGIMCRNCTSIILVIQNGIPTKYRQEPNAAMNWEYLWLVIRHGCSVRKKVVYLSQDEDRKQNAKKRGFQ